MLVFRDTVVIRSDVRVGRYDYVRQVRRSFWAFSVNDEVLTIFNSLCLIIVELNSAVRRIERFRLRIHFPEGRSRIGSEKQQTSARLSITAIDDIINVVTHTRCRSREQPANHSFGSVRSFTLIDFHMISETLVPCNLCQPA